MYKSVFLFALLFATQAQGAATARCGTDAFGNAVCMDKDGVVSTAPNRPVGDRAGGDAKEGTASAGTADDPGSKADYDKEGRARCGVDPFGNTVCRW
jgi:hypothetical protein